MIADAQITFLYTNNLELTTNFYNQIMGLTIVLEQDNCRIFQAAISGYLGFCQKGEAPISGDVIFTLVTNKVDETYRILQENGIICENKPTQNDRYNIYHFFVKDPNGYLIEIQKFNDKDWNTPG